MPGDRTTTTMAATTRRCHRTPPIWQPPLLLLRQTVAFVALLSAFAEASRGASAGGGAGRRQISSQPSSPPIAAGDDSLDSWLLLADEAAIDGSQRPAPNSAGVAPTVRSPSTASPGSGRDSATGPSSRATTTRPPIALTLWPNGTINVTEGEGRDIHCRVYNKPPSAQVQWYYIKRRPHGYGFSNYTVIANHYQTINADKFKTAHSDQGVYTLSVKYFELGDDGQYSCFLYVGFSEAYRESVRVGVLPRTSTQTSTPDASSVGPVIDLRSFTATSASSSLATAQDSSTTTTATTTAASSRAASTVAIGRATAPGSVAASPPPPRGSERRPQQPFFARGSGVGSVWKEKASGVGSAAGSDSRLSKKEPASSPQTAPPSSVTSSVAPPTPSQPAKPVDSLTLDGLEAGGDADAEEELEHLLPDVETLPWSRGGGGGSVQPTAHAARVSTTRCEYQFVVNEVDSGSCPSLSRGGGGGGGGGGGHYLSNEIPEDPGSTSPYREYGAPSAVAAAAVDALNEKLEKLEDRLIDEMVKTQITNHSLNEHAEQLRRTERSTADHARNLSALGGAMQRAEAALERQRAAHRGLDEKLASVMINVAEMGARLDKAMKKMAAIKPDEKAVDVVSAAEAAGCAPLKGVPYFKDCDDAFQKGNKASDVYYVKFIYSACPVPVWCDMDTWPGGWLVIQRRRGTSQKFNLNWADYRKGFGNVSHDFWLGNDNIFLLTNQAEYMLRVDLWDFYDSRVFAEYRRFKIDGERDSFRLHVGNYSGTAKDSLQKHDGVRFSTPDRDHDQWTDYHCAMEWEAGWWFTNCWHAFLNGQYSNSTTTKFKGMAWIDWKDEQLARTEMKVRPVAVLQPPPPHAAAAAEAAATIAAADAVAVPV